MNSNVSINNMYVSAPNLNQKSQNANISRDTFLKLMMLISQNQNSQILNQNNQILNQNNQALNQKTDTDVKLNIINLIMGKSKNLDDSTDSTDLSGINLGLNENSGADVDDDDKTKLNALDNFMIMMNFMNFGNEKIVVKKPESEALVSGSDVSVIITKGSEQYNQDVTVFEKTESSFPKRSFQIEKLEELVTDIATYKDKQKNKIDFSSELILPKEPLIQYDTKIITITDEASQIKPQVLAQIKDKIEFMFKEGSASGKEIKQVTMELQPQNLGKVNIKMIFEDNKITVEIKALNEETQKILSSGTKELANILNKATESSVNVVVKANEAQYDNQPLNYNQDNAEKYNENYDQQNGHNKHRNYYYSENEKDPNDEDNTFSELIDLKNSKL